MNLAFSLSPRHTDEYYAERARGAAALKPFRICLKDVDGLLTTDRARTLVPIIQENAPGIPLELHGHDTTGLATSVALEVVKLGIHIINSTIPPLSYSGAQPSVINLARNVRSMGYEVNINEKPLGPVTEYWTAIAKQKGFPIGAPVEYDSRQYSHQLPGAMIANLRRQLGEVGYEDRMEEVLEETGRVRVDLGYPIMITPLSQFVGTQAAMNIIVGERYKEVSDQVILYALGRYGEEAVTAMDQDVRAKILDRSRARQIEAKKPPDPSIEELRQMYGGALHRKWLDALADDVAAMRARGQELVVVSSGAVALGRRRLGLAAGRPLKLEESQASAACGQIHLAHAYEETLARHDLAAAMVLVTLGDTEDRRRYLNVRSTICGRCRRRRHLDQRAAARGGGGGSAPGR